MTYLTATNPMNLQVNDIVRQHGARFMVMKVQRFSDYQANYCQWLEGEIVPGYFGPDSGLWNVQGNEDETVWKE